MAETYTSRTLREILRIVLSRGLGMLLILAIVIAGVWAGTAFSPRWFRSEVQLLAQPSRETNPLETNPTSMREQVSLFVSTQREIIRSDFVLASALMKLEDRGAVEDWSAAGEQPWYTAAEVQEYIDANKHSRKLSLFKERVRVVTPGGPDATFTQTFTIQVDWPEEKEEMSATDREKRKSSSEKAARQCQELARHIVKAYLDRYSQLERERTANVTALVKDSSLAAVKAEYDAAVKAQADFVATLEPGMMYIINIIAGQGNDTGVANLVSVLENRIAKTNSELAEWNSLLNAITTELAKNDPAQIVVPDDVLKSNPSVNLLQQKMTTLKLALNELESKYTDDHKDVVYLREEIRKGLVDLKAELQRQKVRVEQIVAKLTAGRAKDLEGVALNNQRMKELNARAIQYKTLRDQVAAAQESYEEEQKRYLQSIRAGQLAKNPVLVSVLDDPTRPNPGDPRRPILWLNLLIAIVGGLVLALVYAFMADHFDHTIKSVDDAERYLGIPVLASVPKLGRGIIRSR
jgi:uncharacterized protein involved in exopolysaccharide biosynthesis